MTNPYQAQIEHLESQIAANQALLSDPEMASLAQAEIESLENQKALLTQAAADLADAQADTGGNPEAHTPKNCTIEIRPGAGGDEAKIWANDLLRMYLRAAEVLGLKISYIDDLVVKFSGTARWPDELEWPFTETELTEKASILSLETEQLQRTTADSFPTTPYTIFRLETGVHRVQRVPETESQGRVHTSTASVAVLPEVHPRAIEIRDEDLEWQFMRASGAGGQSVNKTSSAVRLIHNPSGIVVTSRQEKKQEQNRKIALELLRAQLWEIEEEKRLAKLDSARQAIGRNMRAEKIRTYNYPQNRVTDHRINESWYDLSTIIEGYINTMLLSVYQLLHYDEN